MIKGCNKRVIVMKDTGNDMIEEAIFIIKPGCDKGFVGEDDIIKHANSILDKNAYNNRFSDLSMNVVKGRKNTGFASFWSGMVIGAIVSAGIILVF